VEDKQDEKDIKILFQRKVVWRYYYLYTAYMDSDLLKTLKNKPWMYDKKGNLYSPANIRQNELDPIYEAKDWKSSYLLELICGEMEEIFEKLPDFYKYLNKVLKEQGIDPNDIPSEEIYELVNKIVKSLTSEKMGDKSLKRFLEGDELGTTERSLEDSWEPEVQPDEVNLVHEENELEDRKPNIEELVNQMPSENKRSNDQPVRRKAVGPTKNTQKIGEWGERAVLKKLREEYGKKGKIRETASGFIVETEEGEAYEVVWLNSTYDAGKGYDIVVKKDGEEIEFIEVKTKKDESPSLFSVTGTQWEFAKALYEKGEGDRYKIYVISLAGTSRPKYRVLSDPYGMWKEGKIYAHPVNIRL